MIVGYARVSTIEQILDLQKDALAQAGCDKVFEDTISGAKSARPGLEQALSFMRAGDVLVVWRLDRLSRSLKMLIETMNTLQGRGIGLRSLTEQIDTTTPGGKLIFHLFGSLAEFERDLIRERTQAGLAAARARAGRGGGRRSLAHRAGWRWPAPSTRTRAFPSLRYARNSASPARPSIVTLARPVIRSKSR